MGNCNKYFYFSLGGAIAFILLFIYTIIEINIGNEESKTKALYIALLILALIFIVYCMIGLIGYNIGGKSTNFINFNSFNNLFDSKEIKESEELSDNSSEVSDQENNIEDTDPSSDDSISMVGINTKIKEISEKDDKDSTIYLTYINTEKDSYDSYLKKIKKINNSLHLIGCPLKSPNSLYDSKLRIFKFPIIMKSDSENKLEDSVLLRGVLYTSFRKVIDTHIEYLKDIAIREKLNTITCPDLTKDSGIRILFRENYSDESNIEVLEYFVNKLKENFDIKTIKE